MTCPTRMSDRLGDESGRFEYARKIGLVNPRGFVDNRNDLPGALNWRRSERIELGCHATLLYRNCPRFGISNLEMDWSIDDVNVTGYDPNDYFDRALLLRIAD